MTNSTDLPATTPSSMSFRIDNIAKMSKKYSEMQVHTEPPPAVML